MRNIAIIMCCVICVFACSAIALADSLNSHGDGVEVSMDKIYEVSSLEGDWKVVSTTWGGDQKNFIGQVYRVKIQKYVKDAYAKEGEQGLILFTASMKSLYDKGDDFFGFDASEIDNIFCVMRYEILLNTYKFMNGISMFPVTLGFERDECGQTRQEQNASEQNGNLSIGRDKQLIRMDLRSVDKAHAIVYYEISVTELYENGAINEEDIYGETVCEDNLCLQDGTAFFGVFEMELEKVVNSKSIVEPVGVKKQ